LREWIVLPPGECGKASLADLNSPKTIVDLADERMFSVNADVVWQ